MPTTTSPHTHDERQKKTNKNAYPASNHWCCCRKRLRGQLRSIRGVTYTKVICVCRRMPPHQHGQRAWLSRGHVCILEKEQKKRVNNTRSFILFANGVRIVQRTHALSHQRHNVITNTNIPMHTHSHKTHNTAHINTNQDEK